MLSIKSARQELSDKIEQRNFIPIQDHDSEERGVTAGSEDQQQREEDSDEEEQRLLLGGEEGPMVNEPNLYSGEIVIAHLNVIDTIRRQWGATSGSSGNGGENGGSRADMEETARNIREQLRARWGGQRNSDNR